VDGVSLTPAAAEVAGGSRTRIERALVDARVEDLRGAVEDRLGSVPVMDVPVQHQDPLHATAIERVRACHGDVVEQAETHRAISLRVVTGRPEPAERETAVGEQSLGRVDSPARGMKGGLPGTGAGDGVEVEHPAAASGELLDRV